MTALPSPLYADPERIISDAETGDVVPVAKVKPQTCLHCQHVRPKLYEPPCAIHCCPSPKSGRCRCWEKALA